MFPTYIEDRMKALTCEGRLKIALEYRSLCKEIINFNIIILKILKEIINDVVNGLDFKESYLKPRPLIESQELYMKIRVTTKDYLRGLHECMK